MGTAFPPSLMDTVRQSPLAVVYRPIYLLVAYCPDVPRLVTQNQHPVSLFPYGPGHVHVVEVEPEPLVPGEGEPGRHEEPIHALGGFGAVHWTEAPIGTLQARVEFTKRVFSAAFPPESAVAEHPGAD